MASSDFWRDLAEQFRLLHKREPFLSADYSMFRGENHWSIGAVAPEVQALLMRAGSAVAEPSASDPLIAWLQCLMHEGYFQEVGSEVEAAGEKFRHIGRIPALCDRSSRLSKILEVRAIQAKFEEKQRSAMKSDPEPTEAPTPPQPTVAEQLKALKSECRLTAEEMADALKVNLRTVQRQLAGKINPRDKQRRAYERLFSKLLKRKVIISKMP